MLAITIILAIVAVAILVILIAAATSFSIATQLETLENEFSYDVQRYRSDPRYRAEVDSAWFQRDVDGTRRERKDTCDRQSR